VKVLSPREAAVFAAFTDAVAMPEAPFPPVGGTDAVEGLDAWLAAAPAANAQPSAPPCSPSAPACAAATAPSAPSGCAPRRS
jgi:hypothetical protein